MVLQQRPDGRIEIGFTADTMETKRQIEAFASLALGIELEDVDKLVAQLNHLDTIGPIFDPTAYMRVLPTKGGHKRLVVAFRDFRHELQKLAEPAP